MQTVYGYRVQLPSGPVGIELLEKFKQIHCYIRTDESGIVWAMIGHLWDWGYEAERGHGGYRQTFYRAGNANPDFKFFCQSLNLPISPLGIFAMADPECKIPPSHFTFFATAESERLRKCDSLDIGGLTDFNLSEPNEHWEPRVLYALCAGISAYRFPVQYSRIYPYPKKGEIINLMENVTINPVNTSQLVMYFHPAALVNFSVLQIDRSNPVSYWNYLPQDLLAYYIFPMVEHMEVARKEKKEEKKE